MKAPLLLAAVLATLAIGATAAVGATRWNLDSVGTLQVNGTFVAKFSGVNCPADRPATTACYREVGTDGVIAGLGRVSTAYTLEQDGFGSACGHVHALIPIVVAGKGEIALSTKTTGCIAPSAPDRFPPSEVIVSGGSGIYAGASGSGVLEYQNSETAPGVGSSTLIWTGTLTVDGLAFDTTPPQIAGATSKVVKTRLAKGARVTYSVKATDATDGVVPSACLPKSGSLFAVGRTTVSCNPTDSSGNTTTARFVITVKRVHR